MPKEDSKIVLRIPKLNTRWIVDYQKLAIYAQGKRNFTMRVPYVYDDISETDAYAFDGFLLVFERQTKLQSVDNQSKPMTAYELRGCLDNKHVPFLITYMRTLSNSKERHTVGTEHLRLIGTR